MVILHDLTDLRRHENNQKEFVSNVSHELRTPITAVRATAETLMAGAKNDDLVLDRFLRTIVSESDRLSALIDDLLEIAKRDSGIIKTRILTPTLPRASFSGRRGQPAASAKPRDR